MDHYPRWKWFANPCSIGQCELMSPFQHSRVSHAHGLGIGSPTSVELWGSKDVSYHATIPYIPLIPGYSWGAMFLYVYTGQTAFSAIGSQDPTSEEPQNGPSEDETKRRQDPGGLGGPPPVGPCSPKSIYHLAKKVRLSRQGDMGVK